MKNILLLILILPYFSFSQSSIERIEPAFWWAGMNNTQLQIMVYGKYISHLNHNLNMKVFPLRNRLRWQTAILFIHLNIDKSTKPGDAKIEFKNAENKIVLTRMYPILKRKDNAALIKGYDNGVKWPVQFIMAS